MFLPNVAIQETRNGEDEVLSYRPRTSSDCTLDRSAKVCANAADNVEVHKSYLIIVQVADLHSCHIHRSRFLKPPRSAEWWRSGSVLEIGRKLAVGGDFPMFGAKTSSCRYPVSGMKEFGVDLILFFFSLSTSHFFFPFLQPEPDSNSATHKHFS